LIAARAPAHAAAHATAVAGPDPAAIGVGDPRRRSTPALARNRLRLWANSEDLRQYRAQYKVTIPLTLDASGEVFRAFRVNDVPTILIADADGRVVRRIEGSAAQDGAALRAAVSGL